MSDENPELSEDALEQADDTFNDIETNVLLAQILAEQQRTNRILEGALSEADTSDSSQPTVYECDRCGASVKPGEREQHAVGQHSAPKDMVDSLFSEQ